LPITFKTVSPLATLGQALGAAALIGASLFLWAGPAAAQSAEDSATNEPVLSAEQTVEIERLVRDYILNNPEIILQSVQRMEAKREAEQQARAQAALSQNETSLFNDPMDPAHGSEEATVTLVEFFDYQCGYCKRVLPAVMKLAEEQEDLRIVFKEFPILGPASEVAAQAALAADRQGEYMAFHQALMSMRGELSAARIFETAAAVGLDVERLQADMKAPEILAHIEKTRALAQSIGVSGTPAMVVGDTLVPGAISYEQMVALVEAARAEDG